MKLSIMATGSEMADMKRQFSPFFAALMRDCMIKVVLPAPAVPATNTVDGWLNPPFKIESSPVIPEGIIFMSDEVV